MMWNTCFTQQFPCSIPLVGTPMAGVSGGALAAATCRAGALGFIAAGNYCNAEAETFLESEIATFRSHCAITSSSSITSSCQDDGSSSSSSSNVQPEALPLCLGFIGYSTFGTEEGWQRFEALLHKHRPAVVQFFAPAVISAPSNILRPPESQSDELPSPVLFVANHKNNIDLAHAYGCKVLTQVGSVAQAQEALNAGTDGLIVQGSEAGGHGLRRELGSGTLSLARSVVSLVDSLDPGRRPQGRIPVLAAGGIVDGRGLAAVLAAGCGGAVLGTRLWCSIEAMGHDTFKQRLVETPSCDNVVRTTVFDQILNSFSPTPWPWPFDSVGAVRNEICDKWEQRGPEALAQAIQEGEVVKEFRQAMKDGNADLGAVVAGKGVGLIDNIESAYDIISKIGQEARETIQNLSQVLPSSTKSDVSN